MIFTDETKLRSRAATIANPYVEIFGRTSIPKGRTFWSLCADPGTGCELDHLSSLGLFTLEQYVGVNNSEAIIHANREVYPEARWVHDDFYAALAWEVGEDVFRPAIVNYDSTSMGGAVGTARRLLGLLGHLDNLMLVVNVVVSARSHELDDLAMTQMLEDCHHWEKNGWREHPAFYAYSGGSRAVNTKMETHIFWKP